MTKYLSSGIFIVFILLIATFFVHAETGTAPVITNLRVENIAYTGAQIRWTTNVPSSSTVYYGILPETYSLYSMNRCDEGGDVIEHCVNLMNLNLGTVYYFKVVSFASNFTGHLTGQFTSANSTTGGSGGGTTQPPAYLTASRVNNYISLIWGGVPDAGFYNLYRSVDSGAYAFLYSPPGPTYTGYSDGTVTFGHTYRYKIEACRSGYGCSGPVESNSILLSSTISETPTPTPSSTPTPSPTPTPLISYSPTPTPTPSFTPIPTLSLTPTPTPVLLPVVKVITGTVTFSNGSPVTNAGVGAYSKDNGVWISTFVDASGNYTLNVGGGVWIIGVWPKESNAGWKFGGPYPEITFVRDGSAETRTQNISVPISDSRLSVVTVDNKGLVVANAGIIADPISASQTGTTSTTGSANFLQTDAQGRAVLTLRAGTYYVRAFLPETSGLINPIEQTITIGPGETKEIKLVFIRKDTVTALYIKGITRLDNGNATEAFIWVWSEKGRTANTNSGPGGEFSIQISPDDKWHIGAGKIVDGYPYKSSEIVVPVGTQTVSTELILNRLSEQPTFTSTTNTSLASQDITTKTGDGAQVLVPANSVSTSGNLTVEVKPTIEAPSQPSARVFGSAYDISVKNTSGSELTQFSKEITVELPYDPDELTKQNLTEDSLKPSYFDDATGTWVKIDNFSVDKIRKVIIARVNHLTLFAVVLAADIVPPSPPSSAKATALGAGQIALTWTNPPSDLEHINIYRSVNPSSLGKLAGTTKGTAFTDNADISNGITYYYVIRAVDPAGNETSNTTAVAVKAIGDSGSTSVLKDGDMISATGSSDPDIYIINASGYKRLFLNPVIFSFYGHLGGFSKVKGVTSASRDSYITSGLFRNCETNDAKVYGVEVTGEDSGTLHWINISGSQAVAEDPDFFKKVFCINNNEFSWYAQGAIYTSLGQVPNYTR